MDLLPFYDDNPEFHCLTFERKKKKIKTCRLCDFI